jgi:hypothetical protein
MSDIFNDIWHMASPYLIYAAMGFLSLFLPWASNEVRTSDWYARQPWWHRKLIDFFGVIVLSKVMPMVVARKDIQIAVQPAVNRLMSQAEALKATHDGEALKDKLTELHNSAANSALNKIVMEFPKTDQALPGRELVKMIDAAVPDAVEKAKKKRKANPNKPGGAGAHP